MAQEMNKTFWYKDYQFMYRVRLNSKVEKKINGVKLHKVTISDMGNSNWFQEKEVPTNELSNTISQFQILAENFVDKLDNRSKEEKMLSDWGFS